MPKAKTKTRAKRKTRGATAAASSALGTGSNGSAEHRYRATVRGFLDAVASVVPTGATVVVVSKGDDELLKLTRRTGWHFPRRGDGVYAGYYPSDSDAAVAHLETLRAKGAGYIAFPAAAAWWLEHYPGLRRHLATRAELLADSPAGSVYALGEPHAASGTILNETDQIDGVAAPANAPSRRSPPDALGEHVPEEVADDLRALFDVDHYAKQTRKTFASQLKAILHYLEHGHLPGHDPHPLFDTRFYLTQYPHVRRMGLSPLVHFVSRGVFEGLDPNPYFDTDYYYSQEPQLRADRANALVHYVSHAPDMRANAPSALFSDRYYAAMHPEARESQYTPLGHFLLSPRDETRSCSHAHWSLIEALLQPPADSLHRGAGCGGGRVLLFGSGKTPARSALMLELASSFKSECGLKPLALFLQRPAEAEAPLPAVHVASLDDVDFSGNIARPAALRLLARTLRAANVSFCVSDSADAVEALASEGIPNYFLCAAATVKTSGGAELARGFAATDRALFDSSDAFHSATKKAGALPPRAARRPLRTPATAAAEILGLARRDFRVDAAAAGSSVAVAVAPRTRGQIIMPCCDWHVSGVNSALESVGLELMREGWDAQIVFTRDRSRIAQTAGDAHMPRLPYTYLSPGISGPAAMWEALIGSAERAAPCVMFMGYDFLANAVAPALSDKVAVVAWLQSDDGDYYEQAHRLGRYCNSLVCVSDWIRQQVIAINPLLADKSVVIHNSSVRESDIASAARAATSSGRASGKKMRLIYTGRLVQYQKRVLDFVELAQALDRTGVAYELTLLGSFSDHEGIQPQFERAAARHLRSGRIRLPGRLPRQDVLAELSGHDFFVLLSEFEGLPLSLIEAMARGCVPVTPDLRSGIPEAINDTDNGFIVTGRDYDKWARLLVSTWKQPEQLARLSASARETVRRQFTVEQAATKLGELFDRALADAKSGAYRRPACLNWGRSRSPTGDVLPPAVDVPPAGACS